LLSPSKKVNDSRAEEIRKVATEFRRALEGGGKFLPDPFGAFPEGSCGGASEVLGIYLKDELGIDCIYVSAWNYCNGARSHAWLEYGDLTIDITADQFGQNPVVVERGSEWHKAFGEARRRPLESDPESLESGCAAALKYVCAAKLAVPSS
jgi:hypothetical protein